MKSKTKYQASGQEIIDASYFIMEKLEGEPLWAVSFTPEEYESVQEMKIDMLTQIHRIHHNRFGYRQCGLQDTWYDAIRGMVERLITDCNALGKKTEDGERLLSCIDRHRELLSSCPCSMVNFDLWDSNISLNRANKVLGMI